MSSPITFDALPVPDMDALANIPPWSHSQGTALDDNFDAVNAYLTGAGPRGLTRHSEQQAFLDNAPVTGGWQNFAAGNFAPITFTVPPCEALVVNVSARAGLYTYAWVAVRANPSGPGYVGTGLTGNEALSLGCASGLVRWFAGGQTYVIQASWGLRVGQSITFTPQWWSTYATFNLRFAQMSIMAVG